MGLGGYLTWTAAAREIVQKVGIPGMRILPVEVYTGGLMKVIKDDVFLGNPHILQDIEESSLVFPLQLNNPHTNYCKEDTPQRATLRCDKHIIGQICEVYGIPHPELKCDLYFTDDERSNVRKLLKDIPRPFIVVEPQAFDEYTVNKKYPTEKWQWIVDQLRDEIAVVQVGLPSSVHRLTGVVDLLGKTTFREACLVIEAADLLTSGEGGLMHGASAVETDSVIVFTGFNSPGLSGYPNNTNIWIGSDHGPWGMKGLCSKCKLEADTHDPKEILEAIREKLRKSV